MGTSQGTEELCVDTSELRSAPPSAALQLTSTPIGLGVDILINDSWQQAIIAADEQSDPQLPSQDVWVLIAGMYLQLANRLLSDKIV